ncbi:VWA domain-containing protein [Sulfurovum sp.]|uniref:vWA domain-containing protein n=1 Tax=Sulfurovum sp. TaxID=1969726 RepID=UPI002867BBA2|nr:VWA domain-containing protein [Sulfurovum sp.]
MSAFHFLRPEYLLLLLPVWVLVWWFLKQQNDEKKWKSVIAPKLLKYLLVQPEQNASRLATPWHLGIVLSLLVVAVSGPSWKLKESPFTKDDTKIALLVSVKESMLTTDIQPNRLERASIKITDLLAQRSDTQSALIAYSGTAHLVLPLTKDHSVIQTFAQALSPDIMPLVGDNIQEALMLAKKELKVKGSTIIVLTDTLSPSSAKLAMQKGFDDSFNVIFWQIASKELSSETDFKSASALLNAHYVKYARDGSDVRQVSSLIDKNFKTADQGDKSKYEDGGYTLIPLIFLLLLFWARQGFIAELWRRS